MSDNIKPIRADIIRSAGKQVFLDTIADSYDIHTKNTGLEPVTVVFAMVDKDGGCATGYHTVSEKGNSLYVSRAVLCLNFDAKEWDEIAKENNDG